MNVLSICDGISCGQIAFDRNGVNFDGVKNKYFSSEIDKNTISITQKNYPNTIQIGDVNAMDFKEYIDKIDILIGGTPCQQISAANLKGEGLNGKDSKLFFKFIEALQIIQPKYYLFENVGSMTESNKNIISEYFKHQPICLNSNLVSAQSRVRYYWTNIGNITTPEDKKILVKDILENSVENNYYLKQDYIYVPKEQEHKSKSGLIYKCGIISKKKWLDNGKNLSRNFSQGNRVYSIYGKSCCITANAGGLGGKSGLYYLEDGKEFSKNNIRRLNPLETERLQTLPDNYTQGFSPNQRYKMIGNGWTVDIISHLLKGVVIC